MEPSNTDAASTPRPYETATGTSGMSSRAKALVGCAVLLPVLLCCLGVVASTAIPAFLRYVATAKSAEAEVNLEQLAQNVESRCEEGLPTIGAGPLPASPSDQPQVVDFSTDPGFAALHFTPSEPLYYRYSVVPQPDGTTAIRAEADLDGDGTLSLYEITCAPDCRCSGLLRERPLE